MNDVEKLKKPMKYILGYISGFIFSVVLIVYLYMFIVDRIENDRHTTEETAWMYGFLVLLVVGYGISHYLISKNRLF
jgi:hypothetical protein